MIERELEIINKLYETIANGYPDDFDSFEYIYRVNDDEGWSSISLLYFFQNKLVCQNEFEYIDEEFIEKLNCELREVMQKKTGGEWNAFTLLFDGEKIKTIFDYKKQIL